MSKRDAATACGGGSDEEEDVAWRVERARLRAHSEAVGALVRATRGLTLEQGLPADKGAHLQPRTEERYETEGTPRRAKTFTKAAKIAKCRRVLHFG